MNIKSLTTSLLATVLLVSGAQADTKIEFYGNYTRSDYIRLERDGDRGQFIVLSHFMKATETRMFVRDTIVMEVNPPIRVYVAGEGDDEVRLSLQGDLAYDSDARVTFGAGEASLISRHKTPTVRTLYDGYVNRSDYVRVEEWSFPEQESSLSIVTSTFDNRTQERYRVDSHQFIETFPAQEEFRATNHFDGTSVEFTVFDTTPRTATLQINDGAAQSVSLLETAGVD